MQTVNRSKLKETIGFTPHPSQVEVLRNMKRFTTVVSGRRLGKTIMASYLALRELFLDNKSIWVIAPTHDLASRIWEYLDMWIDRHFSEVFKVNKHERIIENVMTRSKLWAKTTETPESLRGKGLDLAILDEAAIIPNGLFDGNIRPNLMDRQGRAFMISNPFGFNWFYDLYLLGTPEGRVKNPDYISFNYPTAIEDIDGNVIGSNNPRFIMPDELASIKRVTPTDIWKQEYLGIFQEGAGQLFKNFDQCVSGDFIEDDQNWFEEPQEGHLYSIGLDIAKAHDFTVMCVMDRMNHRLVGFYRINQMAWETLRQKIKDISEKYYDAQITLDATGMGGDMFVESLAEIGVNVDTEFKYTHKSKMMLIDKLNMLMQGGKIRIPRIPQLINEIRSFTYHITETTKSMKYGSSKSDDAVNALALACWCLTEEPLASTTTRGTFRPLHRFFR